MVKHLDLIKYWQQSEIISKIYSIQQPSNINTVPVTSDEINTLNLPFHMFEQLITDSNLSIDDFDGVSVCFAPNVYTNGEQKIFPYLFILDLDKSGKISVNEKFPFPILPKCLINPYASKYNLFNFSKYEQHLSLYPPEFELGLETPSLSDLLEYSNELIQACANVNIDKIMTNHGFEKNIDSSMLMFAVNQLTNIKSDRIIQDLQGLIEQEVLPQAIKAININEDFEEYYDDEEIGDDFKNIIAKTNNKIKLTKEQDKAVASGVNDKKVNYITATVGTGVKTVVDEIVANIIIKNKLNNKTELNIVKYEHGNFKSLSLLSAGKDISWIKSYKENEALSYPYSSHINEFLGKACSEFNMEFANLSAVKQELTKKLTAANNLYQRGLTLSADYNKTRQELKRKYFPHGGLNSRLKDLQKQLKDKTDSYKHLQVIEALWRRQLSQMPIAIKMISFIPSVKKSRLKRIYSLLEQYFPDENILSIPIKDMEIKIKQLLNQSKFKEKALYDSLAQIESDARQLELIENKYINFCKNNYSKQLTETEFHELHVNIGRYNIYKIAYHIYEAEFLLKHSWSSSVNSEKEINLEKIDVLIIPRAHEVVVGDFISLITRANKTILFGCEDLVTEHTALASFDYVLTKTLNIAEFEDDYDNVMTNGLLYSNSNAAILASLNFNTNIVLDKVFNKQNQILIAINNLKFKMDNLELFNLEEYNSGEIILNNITKQAENIDGDFVNSSQIEELIKWYKSQNNEKTDDLIIICATKAQAVACQDMLQAAGIVNIAVKTIYTSINTTASMVVFLSVFSSLNKGPYNFNEGCKYLYQVASTARDKIIIFGDKKIFDKNLRSPAGKIFNNKIEVQTNITELFDL